MPPPVKKDFVEIPSSLASKTLEEIIVKWNEDLEQQVADFYKKAIELNIVDSEIRANSEKLVKAHDAVVKAEVAEAELASLVNYVSAQQAELEALLDMIETGLDNLLVASSTDESYVSSDDVSRAKIYHQAADLQSSLLRLSTSFDSLSTLLQEKQDKDRSPSALSSLVRALDANLEALLLLRDNSSTIPSRIKNVSELNTKTVREHERLKFSNY